MGIIVQFKIYHSFVKLHINEFDHTIYVHEVLVNRLGGLSLPRKSVVRLTDRPDMTLDVYRGRKTTIQQQYNNVMTVDGRVVRWF